MIKDFKLQTGKTIGNFLERLGKRPRVYSRIALEFDFDFKEMNLYVYVQKREVVLVCMDPFESDSELQCELPVDGQPPVYYSWDQNRVSPVWKLKMAMESFRKALELAGELVPELWGVWVTTSEMHYAEGVENVWDHLGISAIQVDGELMLRHLPLKSNKMLVGASFMNIYWEMVRVKKRVDLQAVQETLIKEFREVNELYSLGSPFDDLDDEEEDDNDEEDVEDEVEETADDLSELSMDSENGAVEDVPEQNLNDDDGAVGEMSEVNLDDDDDDEFTKMLSAFLEEEKYTEQTEPAVDGLVSERFRLQAEILPPMKNAREEMGKLVGCEEMSTEGQAAHRILTAGKEGWG